MKLFLSNCISSGFVLERPGILLCLQYILNTCMFGAMLSIRGRPLEITGGGGGWRFPKKNSCKGKFSKIKFLQTVHYPKKGQDPQCRKIKSCRQLGLKKKLVHWKFFAPPPGISNGPPLNRYRFIVRGDWKHDIFQTSSSQLNLMTQKVQNSIIQGVILYRAVYCSS